MGFQYTVESKNNILKYYKNCIMKEGTKLLWMKAESSLVMRNCHNYSLAELDISVQFIQVVICQSHVVTDSI